MSWLTVPPKTLFCAPCAGYSLQYVWGVAPIALTGATLQARSRLVAGSHAEIARVPRAAKRDREGAPATAAALMRCTEALQIQD